MVRADTQGHVARTLVAPTLSGATLSGAAHRRRAHVPLSARLACGIVAALVGSALTVSTPARVHAQTASGAVERAALPTRNPKAKRGASTRRDDTWPADVIANARAECFSLLADLEAEYEPLDPIKAGRCGAPSPVRLISIGTGPEIKFTPPARLNCPMVAAVARWIGKRAQQRAAKQLGSRIVSVVNMSAYSCRNRNNSPTGRLSEHAFANALDVGAFKLADGKTVSVLRDWGPAERDLLAFAQRETAKEAERRRIAQERANRQRQAAARQTREASARSDPGRTPAAGANARSAAQRLVRRPRAESSTQGQALPARKAARAAQGSQTAAPSRAAANAPAAAKPPLKVTPQQAVRLAELELAVAKARLLAAERDRDLTKAESDTARLRSELEAMLNGPLDIDAFLNERRRSGRGQRRRTGEAANTAPPAPRQNPGRTALDRARRQAERKLAQVDAQQAAAERREAARKRAIAARERRARRTRRALRRAERTLARAAQRQTRATTALEKAQDDLGAFLSQLTVNTDAPAPRQRSDSRPLNRTVKRSAAPAVTRTVSRSISAAQASGSRTAATVRPLQTTRRVRRDLAGTKPDPRAIENASPRVKQLVEERRAGQRTAKATFLRDVYADACKIFGTVLSPDANEAHRNHFHVDLAKRRRSAYCR